MCPGRDVVEGDGAREVQLRKGSGVPCGHEDVGVPGPTVSLQRLLAAVVGTGTHPFVSADANVACFYEHIRGHDGAVSSTRQRPNRNL